MYKLILSLLLVLGIVCGSVNAAPPARPNLPCPPSHNHPRPPAYHPPTYHPPVYNPYYPNRVPPRPIYYPPGYYPGWGYWPGGYMYPNTRPGVYAPGFWITW